MAHYLVTGGAGFIGSHLVDKLIKLGHSVTVLDDLSTGNKANLNSKAKLVVGDIRDSGLVNRCILGASGCFHLAAVASVQQSVAEWRYTHEVNSTGTVNIFDAAAKMNAHPIPVIYASSAAIYGNNRNVPLKESETPRPLSAYGADKLSCEHHALIAGLIHKVPTKGFRFFNVYGPRQDPSSPYSGVISIFANRLFNKQAITVFGDGEQSRDFVYVSDVVDNLIAGLKKADLNATVLNVCTGRETTINHLAKTIAEISNTQPVIQYESARSGDINKSIGNPLLAYSSLGVENKIEIEEGLAMTLESMNAVQKLDRAS